jgi:hypothetical protein
MGKNKDLFTSLRETFEKHFKSFEKAFESIEDRMPDDSTDTETFEVSRGDVKTTATITFNKKGYATSVKVDSEYTPSAEDDKESQRIFFRKRIEEAVEKEDYKEAAVLQQLLRDLG